MQGIKGDHVSNDGGNVMADGGVQLENRVRVDLKHGFKVHLLDAEYMLLKVLLFFLFKKKILYYK